MIPTDEMVRAAHQIIVEKGHWSLADDVVRAALSAALAAMWRDHVVVPIELSEDSIDLLDYNLFNDDNEGFWDSLLRSQGASLPAPPSPSKDGG